MSLKTILEKQGYTELAIERILEHARATGTLKGSDIKTEHLSVIESHFREEPLVAARLRHARDAEAAKATVRNCIYGDAIEIPSWERSSTNKQIKLAFRFFTDSERAVTA